MIETLKKRPCWNCGSEVSDLYFCSHCASLQKLPEEIDYFTCLGLGYRLMIDPKALETKFYELSRKFHPDFYQKKSQEERAISLENAAILNKGYRTLKDPIKRIEYLVGLAEGEGAVKTEAPSDLFDEIFDLQETLEEVKTVAPEDAARRAPLIERLKKAQAQFQERQARGNKELETLSAEWDRLEALRHDRAFTEEQKASLGKMKKSLSHRGYLERILSDIDAAIGKGS